MYFIFKYAKLKASNDKQTYQWLVKFCSVSRPNCIGGGTSYFPELMADIKDDPQFIFD